MVYDFKLEKFRRNLDNLKALREEIVSNWDKIHKPKDKIVLWLYIRIMNIEIPLGEWMLRKETKK